MRECWRRAIIRLRFIAFISEAVAPAEEFLTIVARLRRERGRLTFAFVDVCGLIRLRGAVSEGYY